MSPGTDKCDGRKLSMPGPGRFSACGFLEEVEVCSRARAEQGEEAAEDVCQGNYCY